MPESHYQITSVCKGDLRYHYSRPGIHFNQKALDRLKTMTKEEMTQLAELMADDYIEQLFWSSMGILFEDNFLKEET
jgi:hypothetical protein